MKSNTGKAAESLSGGGSNREARQSFEIPSRRPTQMRSGSSRQLQSLGERVRAERIRRGMTQMELAIEVGNQPQSICNIEADRRVPAIELGQRIADVFGWSLDRLYNGKN